MPDMTPGVASALSPLVRRIVAPNPGRMTLTGTNTYLVGIDEVAVIDPGPDDAGHIEAIVGASMRERIRWILVTHHHVDHSAGVNRLKRETGAEVVAFGPPKSAATSGEGAGWAPDRKAQDGEVIEGTEWGLEVLHTPGHASDHLCFFLEEERVLFTGDTVLSGTTAVINPPDGDMAAYLRTLRALLDEDIDWLAPGHGFLMAQPKLAVQSVIDHRLKREAKVLATLKAHTPATLEQLLPHAYDDVDPRMLPVAARSLLAHLDKLRTDGVATEEAGHWALA
jgi:glyoxylase-like metal-dependent hydrolase (beta-lactamase superfamily II)